MDGIGTDHLTVFASFRMPRVPSYTIDRYSYRHLTEEGHVRFGQRLDEMDWGLVTSARTVDEAVGNLHDLYRKAMDESYEMKTRKKKSCELEWMTDWLRKDIESRRNVFKKDQKRTDRWRVLKRATASAVKKCKKKYNDGILAKFEAEQNPGKFFHHLNCLMGKKLRTKVVPHPTVPGNAD